MCLIIEHYEGVIKLEYVLDYCTVDYNMYINVLTVITIIMYSLCVIVKHMFNGYVFHYNLNHALVFPKPEKYIYRANIGVSGR